MCFHKDMLSIAAKLARSKNDDRRFCLGGIGIRKDGVIVQAVNGNPKEPEPKHHCESRLCRKLDKGSIVYVARTLFDGTWANSMPCKGCRMAMRNRGVIKCYFTIAPMTYGVLQLR